MADEALVVAAIPVGDGEFPQGLRQLLLRSLWVPPLRRPQREGLESKLTFGILNFLKNKIIDYKINCILEFQEFLLKMFSLLSVF